MARLRLKQCLGTAFCRSENLNGGLASGNGFGAGYRWAIPYSNSSGAAEEKSRVTDEHAMRGCVGSSERNDSCEGKNIMYNTRYVCV